MTAIQDFSTQLRTSRARTSMPQPVDPEVFRRALETLDISSLFTPSTSVPASLAVPPPDLARHAQPEPEVERQVDPLVDPVVAPVVEPEVEPTVNVESHHPSTEVHGVVGESIMVVERYVTPHRDDDTSGCSRISPPPLTPPRTRRGWRGSQSLVADDSLVLHIPSRVVRRGIRLRGEAARIYREFDLASLELPPSIPIGEEVSVWGHRWIVRQYTRSTCWSWAFCMCPNLAGYINSVIGTRRSQREPNVMWVLIEDPPASSWIFEEHVTSSEDGDFDGLQDEEDAMDDLFAEWFPTEPPTDGYHSDQPMDEEHRGVTMEDEDRRTKRRRAAAAREQQTAYEFSRTPIYPGAKCSRLSYTLLILNLQARFGCSNECISGIFRLLAEKILPEGSDVPNSHPEAKKVLTAVGMDYEMIHACENDCILYRNEYSDITSCPECQTSRYRTDTQGTTIPRKVKSFFLYLFYVAFLLFRCRPLADMMTWHKEHRSDDGFMRLVVDSPAVQHVEQTWPEFRRDPRHLCFGLASDGVSLYGVKSSSHSTWPVVLTNYNVPPWLASKKGFLLLALIIPATSHLAPNAKHRDIGRIPKARPSRGRFYVAFLLFRCRPLADMMTWHKEHRSDDGFMRLVVDSPAVQHVEQTWPEFRRDPRHLCFGLASDGVSLYGVKSSSHSTWPVVLTNYNVPPWLASKKGFLLLALIIPGIHLSKKFH
ncbi:hypothetical protein R1sor_002439 [Riccia sorocarpa]|uniref:Uncharacterized protein n=1 Tax=Riccia sorocarpa TaxID=122646 RepID=A0ABD3H1F5_9MARC